MRRIKRFDPWSVMKVSAICYGAMGLLEGAIFSLVFSLVPLTGQNGEHLPRFLGVLFGALSIVFLPIILAVMGAIMGGLGAAVYNVSAKFVGGIQVEVE
jgi:prepilin signal peptidase PulO-like enzyme (type II secretory pathway)